MSATRAFKFIVTGFFFGLIVSVRSIGVGAPVEVEGAVRQDTAWSGEVLVAGDVLVPEGVTLTIMPGTKVMFVASESSKIEPVYLSMQTEIMVRGRLLVKGGTDRPVVFMPAPEDMNTKRPERGDWGGLIFDGPASGGSVIANARFVMADTAVQTFNSSPAAVGCSFEDCRYGVVCMGGGRPVIAGCVITGGEFGVVAARGSKPSLEATKVEGNEHDLLLRD